MNSMIKITIISIFVALAFSNSHLNLKYRSILNGEGDFDASVAREIYSEFKSKHHDKSEYRFNIFLEKIQKIRAHNSLNKSYRKGLNDFSDMTFEEFKAKKLMEPQHCSATKNLRKNTKNLQSIPISYEWNSYGVVTPVKDQGECGSCWSFSTVGAMESHWNILGKGRNVTFSEQQLVDCAGDFDNHGCNGGLPSHAFEYIKHIGGLQTDLTYPYTAKTGQCVFRRGIAVGYAHFGSFNITQGDENELAERLYNAGPVSISFEVTDDFVDYESGIFREQGCGTTDQDVNHAVLATGYGNENGIKFWNVKNSWSTEWGVNGYFKISRGQNMCALAQCNSYPMIERPDHLA